MTRDSRVRRLLSFAVAMAFAAVGCVPPPVAVAVQTVDTASPGVRYVIVHPNVVAEKGIAKDAEGKRIAGSSEYILYCDGRSPDGMTCTLVPEVGPRRASNAGVPTKPGKKVDDAIGVLNTKTIEIDKDKDKHTVGSPTPPPSTPTTAPLPPTTPPPTTTPEPAPPPPPPPSPSRQKGKK